MAFQDADAPPAEPDSAALLRAAARAGEEQPSERQLETFRAQGLLPRPRRAGHHGRTPLWRYPPARNGS